MIADMYECMSCQAVFFLEKGFDLDKPTCPVCEASSPVCNRTEVNIDFHKRGDV